MKRNSFFSILLALSITLPTLARVDEGMWTFNNVPRAEIKRKYGFDVTDEWLRRVQLASVRFNSGGSGSFVSPTGLVLTNHHVASETLQKLSTEGGRNLVKEGYTARTAAEELKAPDIELNVLQSIEDVTARVSAAVRPEMSAAEQNAARRAVVAQIEQESTTATGLRSDVVTLYQGGQYNLYRYKKYTDVRLVFAPEYKIAFFGGDPDNFNFPRYNLDMTLFRVYENDQPVKVENYLPFKIDGAKENELVFTSGHPGSTERLNTVAHLEFLRDTGVPLLLRYLERTNNVLKEYGKTSADAAFRVQDEIFSLENGIKAYRGRDVGLKDAALINRKRADEDKLRRSIAADPRRQKEYGDAFAAIAKARRDLASYERERRFLESGWGFNTALFGYARTLLRLAAESAKPNEARLPEFQDARRAPLERALYSPAPLYDDFELRKLSDSLAFMQAELGASNPLVTRVLQGKTPQARAAELLAGTKLKDPEARKQLAQGGQAAIDASDDPMILLAKSIDPEARSARKRYEEEVTAVERANYAKIARALFETEGTRVYPDATFTLRLSYGAVKGYEENGKRVPAFTKVKGVYDRSAQFGARTPYDLPQTWTASRSKLDLDAPFNFVTTNDIIGGNSGSPVVNAKAELVGLVFDGNIQSLVGNFIYDERQNRTVSVHPRAMIDAIRKVYGADALAAELLASAKGAKAMTAAAGTK